MILKNKGRTDFNSGDLSTQSPFLRVENQIVKRKQKQITQTEKAKRKYIYK
jgi:hypothetical protein